MLWRMAEENHKAGMCRDEEGPKALAPVLLWLKRWKRDELPRNEPWRAGGTEEPSTVCRWVEAWWLECLGEDGEDDSITRRAGGRRRKTAEEVIASVAKALPGYLFFLPRLFVLSRVLFSKGYSDLFSHLDRHCFSWMLSRVSITITCSAYGSSAPTLVENTVVLNAWCLVNVLLHLIMNGNKNVIDKNQGQ